MDSFERLVRDCAKNNRSTVIENASQEHALVLIRVLFETALRHKEEIRIVSGSLLKPFYEQLVDTARQALDSGVRFSVLVRNGKQLEGNRFAELMTEHKNGSIATLEDDDNKGPHFVVVGARRYRVEMDDERKIALAAFNDDTIAPLLQKLHDGLTKKAGPVHYGDDTVVSSKATCVAI